LTSFYPYPGSEKDNIGIVVATLHPLPNGIETSKEFMQEFLKPQRQQIDEIRAMKDNATLSGMPANMVDYIIKLPSTHRIDYFLVKNGTGYQIGFSSPAESFNQYYPILQKMVNSFKTQ
jgi:hypothetical protein